MANRKGDKTPPVRGKSGQSILSGVVEACHAFPTHVIWWTGSDFPVQPNVALAPSPLRFHHTLPGGMTSAQPTAESIHIKTKLIVVDDMIPCTTVALLNHSCSDVVLWGAEFILINVVQKLPKPVMIWIVKSSVPLFYGSQCMHDSSVTKHLTV